MNRRELIALLANATAGWPLTASAQQKATPVIGYLSSGSPDVAAPFLATFRQGLSETGCVDGQNVMVEHHWEGSYDRVPALAAELVRRKVDLIATGNLPGVLAAKSATSTIPIVFVQC